MSVLIPLQKKNGFLVRSVQRLGIWKWLSRYFTASIVTETPLDSSKQFIFCMFPHGAYSWNHFLTMTDCCGFLSEIYKGPRRDLIASILFYIPGLRELCLFLGCVDASPSTAKYNISKGRSIFIYIGGEKEQLMTEPSKHKIYLSSRKGFVKLALQHGTPLVPMYCYGENECYSEVNLFFGFRKWLQHQFKIVVPFVYGRWYTLIPYKVKMTVEIGNPVHVSQVDNPTQKQIDEIHETFTREMLRLFDRTKGRNGFPTAKLEIF